jgi:hypothetical protein
MNYRSGGTEIKVREFDMEKYGVRYSTMSNGSAKFAGRSGRYRIAVYRYNDKTGKWKFDREVYRFYGSKVQWDAARKFFDKMLDQGYIDFRNL